MIKFFSRTYDSRSINRVNEVLASGFLTSGPICQSVEELISELAYLSEAAGF